MILLFLYCVGAVPGSNQLLMKSKLALLTDRILLQPSTNPALMSSPIVGAPSSASRVNITGSSNLTPISVK